MDKVDCSLKEIEKTIFELKKVFDVVRLVDPIDAIEYSGQDGKICASGNTLPHCYEVWGKGQRCENCISLAVLNSQKQSNKFEFVGDKVFFIVSQFVRVDGKCLTLEMVKTIEDAFAQQRTFNQKLVEKISEVNGKLNTDELTGVGNRRSFNQALFLATGSSTPNDTHTMFFIDIDGFKAINDTFGHVAGDEILVSVADILRFYCGEDENVRICRYGGDEFIVFSKNTNPQNIIEKVKKAMTAVKKSTYQKSLCKEVTLSVGVATYGDIKNMTCDEIITALDERMYRAKKGGKDRISFI